MASRKHIDDLPDELLVRILWSSSRPVSRRSGDAIGWDLLYPTYASWDEPRYEENGTLLSTLRVPPTIAEAAYNLLVASICRRWRRLAKLHVSTLLVKVGRRVSRDYLSAAVASLPNLTHLHLCESSLEVLDDAFLAHLASSCRKLTAFHIGNWMALRRFFGEGEDLLTEAGIGHFFGRCSQLEHLSLNGLPAGFTLPDTFFQLAHLRSLAITESGSLRGAALRSLSHLAALSINVHSWDFEQLSDLVHLTGLTCLSIAGQLKYSLHDPAPSPFYFAQLSSLTSLQLSSLTSLQLSSLVSLPLGLNPPTFDVMFPPESPCSRLERLVLSGCVDLEIFPEEADEMFPCLRDLTITRCEDLSELPEQFSSLHCLQKLEISRCSLMMSLPETFGHLPVLKTLRLNGLPLARFPASFGQLKFLETLLVAGCKDLEELPTSFTLLTSLKSLFLMETPRLVLPEDIGLIANLQELLLDSYQAQQLPISITGLASLTLLKLEQCMIAELPEAMGQLRNLRELHIRFCPIRELPMSITTLLRLEILVLANCRSLNSVPRRFDGLTRLRQLELSGSQLLTEFPESLPSSLQTLSLCSLHQQVTRLPAAPVLPRLKNLILSIQPFPRDLVSRFTSLEDLSVVMGSEEELPFRWNDLPRLRSLEIASSGDLRLPGFSGSTLQQLRKLNLLIDGMTELPVTISELQKLTSLEVRAPKLLTLPDTIGSLTRLCKLALSYCSALTELPASLTQLAYLQELVIREGSFRSLPANFAPLSRLQRLELRYCTQLEALPEELRKLKLLRRLNARGSDQVCDNQGILRIPGARRLMYSL